MTIGRSTRQEKGGGPVKKALAASLLAAALAAGALAGVASAADQVRAGRTIEAFIGTNLVDVQGYPANRAFTLEVIRNGVPVGRVGGTTDATGFAEFNHVGGGQVPAGDCFRPPVTPDVMPGDTIRTRVAGETTFDSAVVRDLSVDFPVEAEKVVGPGGTTYTGNIIMTGNVNSFPEGVVVPGTDVLEARLNKGSADVWDSTGRRDLREDVGADVEPSGVFRHVFEVGVADARDWDLNPGEAVLEWSAAAAGAGEALPPAIFVADEGGGEPIVGCPPLAEYAITSGFPTVLNKATVGGGVRFAGIARNATAVSVTLNDADAATDPVVLDATLQDAHVATYQTWRTAAMTAGQISLLRGLDDGSLTAAGSYTVGGANRAGVNLRILKDTVAPASVPRATPRPGVYPRKQLVTLSSPAGTTIHYRVGGTAPVTADAPKFVRPIGVGTTRTIRAAAFDPAGNRGPVGFFRYVIRR